jgi:hypothetical protein
MNLIQALLKWLWKWEKGSKRMSYGEQTQKYLGASEKGMITDVRDFLREIRMQDKLPDILKQRNMSIEEFKRLDGLNTLYRNAEMGSPNAQNELERMDRHDNTLDELGIGGRGTVEDQLESYNKIKDDMHGEGKDFITSPEQKQRQQEDFIETMRQHQSAQRLQGMQHPHHATGEIRLGQFRRLENLNRMRTELAMENVPQTDERTHALEDVRRKLKAQDDLITSIDYNQNSINLGPIHDKLNLIRRQDNINSNLKIRGGILSEGHGLHDPDRPSLNLDEVIPLD